MSGYISEFRYVGGTSTEFIEIAVPAGTDVSGYSVVVYNSNGTVAHTYSLGSLESTTAGTDVYVIDNGTAGFSDILTGQAFALINDVGGVDQFVSFGGSNVTATSGPASGETSTSVGSAGPGQSLQSDDDGGSYFTQTSSNKGTVPCYAPGTMIDTPIGPRAVETLKAGDLVMTLDRGPQAILWTRSGNQSLEDAKIEAKPVQIKAGALGANLPAHNLIVSPQHRILVGGGGQLADAFTTEAFVPAKSLTSLPGICHMQGKARITWIHFACDGHEVVRANGCLSESLLLGPMVVNGLRAIERRVLTDTFGTSTTPEVGLNGPPARVCLTVGATKRQLAEHLKGNGQPSSRNGDGRLPSRTTATGGVYSLVPQTG